MAQIIDNPKGFKVIECSAIEILQKFNGLAICDFCNKAARTGYYVAVLNAWYCPKCYSEWISRAIRYEEDSNIEERNFNRFKQILGL